MDENGFVPQTGGLGVSEGHEESDLSIKGIITFLACLTIAGVLTFLVGRLMLTDVEGVGLGWWEKQIFHEQRPLTAAEQQLQNEREAPAASRAAQAPEWSARQEAEERLGRTFPTPRLQYDDAYEMQIFRGDEDNWLANSGKTAAGNIHIPIEQAKDLLVKQGIPKLTAPFVPPTLPSAAPMVPAAAAQRAR